MSLNHYYDKALTYTQYVSQLGENLALHQLHYSKAEVPAQLKNMISKLNAMRVLVITETWCGDSLALVPLIRKLIEINQNWEIKVILRDENPDLIDRFLTNGARAIPIFLFLDANGELMFRWGPRPQAAQDIFEQHRDQINRGELEKKDVIKKIRTFYAKDRGTAAYDELFLHLTEIKNAVISK
jgi:hypothetical protein